jgi:hypothetical protein
MLKNLRVATTALSLTAGVLLIALWVRSYWQCDWISGDWIRGRGDGEWHFVEIKSIGGFLVWWQHNFTDHDGGNLDLSIATLPFQKEYLSWVPWYGRFERYNQQTSKSIITEAMVPYWMLLLALFVLSVIPWLSWSNRFSLRTLLIATSLVALGLGMIVAAT